MEILLNIVPNVLILVNNLNVLNVKNILMKVLGYMKLNIQYISILNV